MKFAKGSPIAVWVLVYWAAFTSTSRASRSGPRDDILRFIQDLNDDFNSLKIEYANLVEELNDLEISLATQAEFLRDAVTGTEKEEIGFAIADQGRRIEELEATVTMQKSTIDMLVEKERQRALLHQGNDKILVDGESSGEREQSKRAVHTEEGRWMSNIRTLGRRDSNTVAFSSAMRSVLLSEAHAQNVSFRHMFINEGGSFDPNEGVFVCQVPGIYYFTFTMRTFDGHYIGVILMKNADIQVSMQTDADDRSLMQSQSVVLWLQRDDKVYLRLSPSGSRNASFAIYDNHNNYVTFSGFRIA